LFSCRTISSAPDVGASVLLQADCSYLVLALACQWPLQALSPCHFLLFQSLRELAQERELQARDPLAKSARSRST
jgi:hypothetical protein